MSHKLGHCDLFSYKSLVMVPYNNHDEFYIILFFEVLKNSILIKVSSFHTFLPNKVFFRNLALNVSFF